MGKEKELLTQAVAKMRTAIDEFGEGLEESGIQWKSYEMDDRVRSVYALCHTTVNELEMQLMKYRRGGDAHD